MELQVNKTKGDLAFAVIATITAGFFWLTIARFLSSYDSHMNLIERTVQELDTIEQATNAWRRDFEVRLLSVEFRIAELEKAISAKSVKDEV